MATKLSVKQEESTENWLVEEDGKTLATFVRLEEARAYARGLLLERGKGSVSVYTPSGRERERLNLNGGVVHAV
jgi:predicted RNase H-like HicB family nuclease